MLGHWTQQDHCHGHLSQAEASVLIWSIGEAPLDDGLFLVRTSSNSNSAVVSFVLGGQVRHSSVREDRHQFSLGDDQRRLGSIEALVGSHGLLTYPLKTSVSGY